MPKTANVQLTIFYIGLFAASVAILFVIIYFDVSQVLRQQAQKAVSQEIADLMDDYHTGGMEELAAVVERRIAGSQRKEFYYGVVSPSGARVAGSLGTTKLVEGWSELDLPPLNATDEGDEPRRLSILTARLSNGGSLEVGFDTHRIDEAQDAILNAFALTSAVALLMAVGGGIFISINFLRRVDEINTTMEAVVAGDLTQRATLRGTGDELDRLSAQLNEMLDRIESLMEAIKQVSNDIAHDLRTPLGRLKQRLETARMRAQSTDDYAKAVDEAIEDSDALIETFSALLRIAQIEAGAARRNFKPVDLSDLSNTVASTYSAVIEAAEQKLQTNVESGVWVSGDRNLLTQMIANLIENAVRYAPKGALIELNLSSHGSLNIVEVADSGPGIPASERHNVTKRFYRLERSRTTPGSGLGLALVKAISDLHHGTLEFADNQPGLRVSVSLPRTPAA